MAERLLLIANPAASGFTGSTYREVTGVLGQRYQVETAWPSTPEEARQTAARAALEGVEMVVAFGGDGVVHHVGNGVARTETRLGIIPAGTTNVLARILRVPRKPGAAARFLASEPPSRRLAVADLAWEERGGERATSALFSVGTGYDAEVVEQAEREPLRKLSFGEVHYARAAAWVLWSRFRDRPPHLRVESDERRGDAVGVVVQVQWPYTYFRRLPLAITPEPSDGLAALVIERLRLARIPGFLLRAAGRRGLEAIPGMQVWPSCDRLTLMAEPPALLQADGELLGRVTRVEITYAPDRLAVAAPS